ncbi:MAG TPA: YceI family protein [Opitutaceae bacterium]
MKFSSVRRLLLASALLVTLTSALCAEVEVYKIDPVHSSVGFSIRHFVSKVPGTFTKFSGTISVDRDNLENSSTEATIETPSINTANEKRDNHLRSPDFFEAEKYGAITFKSTSWKKTGEDTFDVAGDLTIKGVTKPVVLKTKLLGFGPGARGAKLSGWEATTTIKKSEFNVSGPAMLGTALGDEVTVTINIEANDKM